MLKSGFIFMFSPSELNSKGHPALQGRIWVEMLSLWDASHWCLWPDPGSSCQPFKEGKPVYECFSKRPTHSLELAYWQGLRAEASVALMQPPGDDIWKAGSGKCTSVKVPWLELQPRAGQTPEHGVMKLSAAIREIQASSDVCSGRISRLQVLFAACCCLWTPWGFDNL